MNTREMYKYNSKNPRLDVDSTTFSSLDQVTNNAILLHHLTLLLWTKTLVIQSLHSTESIPRVHLLKPKIYQCDPSSHATPLTRTSQSSKTYSVRSIMHNLVQNLQTLKDIEGKPHLGFLIWNPQSSQPNFIIQ